jgi:hypothetical protein
MAKTGDESEMISSVLRFSNWIRYFIRFGGWT